MINYLLHCRGANYVTFKWLYQSFWQNLTLITCFCCWSLVVFMSIAPTVRCGKRICKDLKLWTVFVRTAHKAVAQAVRVILLLLWIWIFLHTKCFCPFTVMFKMKVTLYWLPRFPLLTGSCDLLSYQIPFDLRESCLESSWNIRYQKLQSKQNANFMNL